MPRAKPRLALAAALDPASPRDVLRQRQAEWDVAQQAARAAEALLQRARADVEAAEAQVEVGQEAETRIRAHKVQVLRDGGSAAAALPELLQIARGLHRDAKDALGDAHAVVETVQADVEAAWAEYDRVGKTVELAAQDVVKTEDAARVAAALRAAHEMVDALTWALTGITSIHVRQNFAGYNPGAVGTPFERSIGPMTFPPDVFAVLRFRVTGDPIPHLPGYGAERCAEWRDYFSALQQDADALPPV